MSKKYDHCDGVGVIITDETRFFLQRKDRKHPNKLCWDKLSLFGGNVDPGEDRNQAIVRELREELNIPNLDYLVKKLKYIFSMELDAVQWSGEYLLHVFKIVLSEDDFDDFFTDIESDKVMEGSSEILYESELRKLLYDDGINFIASIEKPLIRFLS